MIPLIIMDVKLSFNIVIVRIQCDLFVYSFTILDHQMNLLSGDFKINFSPLGNLDKSVNIAKYLNTFSRT